MNLNKSGVGNLLCAEGHMPTFFGGRARMVMFDQSEQ